ncbi:DUF1648 domain-containing protein [Streptomyces sp. NPDC093225]|uniref:DUF1648 domain-containing protein n=1 Tax=Streptomyces sp. NPDC093225 TaxID=3366034 RepID=UPI003826ABA1
MAWAAGVGAVLAGLPLAVGGRLPDRLATHWGAAGPDGSMPLWAAALLPALSWAVLVLSVGLTVRRGALPARGGLGAVLPAAAVFLTGVQAAVVRANLDRADWRQAGSVAAGVAIGAASAVLAGVLGWAAARRGAGPGPAPAVATAPGDAAAPGDVPAAGPAVELPDGARLVWLSRTSNRWLSLLGVVAGVVAFAALAAAAAGATDAAWAVGAPFAVVALAGAGCSSVTARVTERGLEVAFGPLGRPVRRWAVQDVAAARVETRRPVQVGGWGYRLSGHGTTVMLRAGECLVVSPRTGAEFAVSVDDAARGAALLNALTARPPG